METISNTVGKNGKNDNLDVRKIQALLKASLPAKPAIIIDGQYGPRTFKAILQYQMSVFPLEKDWDGRISPRGMTLRALNDAKTQSVSSISSGQVEAQALKLGGYQSTSARAGAQVPQVGLVPLRTVTSSYQGQSGIRWCREFPNSTSRDDLASPFRESFNRFWSAMVAAGFKFPPNTIGATFRPLERAYLMHWAYKIGKESFDARQVPPQKGVNINWVHLDSKGAYDPVASKSAANAMNLEFRSKFPPSLSSNHIGGNAVDMTYSWNTTISMVDGNNKTVQIPPGTLAGCKALHAVGATYGVIKHPTDEVHWSINGR